MIAALLDTLHPLAVCLTLVGLVLGACLLAGLVLLCAVDVWMWLRWRWRR